MTAKCKTVFDSERAILKSPDMFKRFNVTGNGVPLNETNLKPKEVLLVFERAGERRALLQKQMVYHLLLKANLPVNRILSRSERSATAASV